MTAGGEMALVVMTPFFAREIPTNVRLSCRIDITNDLTIKTYPKIRIDW